MIRFVDNHSYNSIVVSCVVVHCGYQKVITPLRRRQGACRQALTFPALRVLSSGTRLGDICPVLTLELETSTIIINMLALLWVL